MERRAVTTIRLTARTRKLLRDLFKRENLDYNAQNVNTFVNRILTNVLERQSDE